MFYIVNPSGRSDRRAKRRRTATKRARARSRVRHHGVSRMATRRRRRATARRSTHRRRRRVHSSPVRRRRRRAVARRRTTTRRRRVSHRAAAPRRRRARRHFRRNPGIGVSMQNVKDALAVGAGELLTAQIVGTILSYLPDTFVTGSPAAATGVASVASAVATAYVTRRFLPKYAAFAVAGSLWAGIRATAQQTTAGQQFFTKAAPPLLAKKVTAPTAAATAGVAGYSRPALVRGGMKGYSTLRSGYNVSAGEAAYGGAMGGI